MALTAAPSSISAIRTMAHAGRTRTQAAKSSRWMASNSMPAPVFVDACQQGAGGRIEIVPRALRIIEDDAIDWQPAALADEISVRVVHQPLLFDAVRSGKPRRRSGQLRIAQRSRISGSVQSHDGAIRLGGQPVKIAGVTR